MSKVQGRRVNADVATNSIPALSSAKGTFLATTNYRYSSVRAYVRTTRYLAWNANHKTLLVIDVAEESGVDDRYSIPEKATHGIIAARANVNSHSRPYTASRRTISRIQTIDSSRWVNQGNDSNARGIARDRWWAKQGYAESPNWLFAHGVYLSGD